MNAALTAENKLAWVRSGVYVQYGDKGRTTHENEGRVQVLITLFHVIPVKISRFPAVHSEEVGARVLGPPRVEELLEGGFNGSGSH